MRIQVSKRIRKPSTVKKLDVNRLKDSTVDFNFHKAMDVALDGMNCLTNPGEDANQKWAHLREKVHATVGGGKNQSGHLWLYETQKTRIGSMKTMAPSPVS